MPPTFAIVAVANTRTANERYYVATVLSPFTGPRRLQSTANLARFNNNQRDKRA